MQEFGKFDFKIYFTPNRLEKYMSINLYDKLVFIHSFQFLSFLLDSCVKNLFKNYFKHLSQELIVSDLVKQKAFYPYGHMSSFERFLMKH